MTRRFSMFHQTFRPQYVRILAGKRKKCDLINDLHNGLISENALKYSKNANYLCKTSQQSILDRQTGIQTVMTGISPSRVLKTISTKAEIKSGWIGSFMPEKWSELSTISLAGHSCVPRGICSICLHWELHFSPPSRSSYMMVFSHHTQSLSGGVCTWLYDNLSISGGNEEASWLI